MNKFLKLNMIKGIFSDIGIRNKIPCRYLTVQNGKGLLQCICHIIRSSSCIWTRNDNRAHTLEFFNRRICAAFESGTVITLKSVYHCLERCRKKVVIHRCNKCYIVGSFKILKKDVKVMMVAAAVIFTVFAVTARQRWKIKGAVFLYFAVNKIRFKLLNKLGADTVFPWRTVYNQKLFYFPSPRQLILLFLKSK